MTNTELDVIAIGNAIVDVVAQADDDFLIKHDLSKGTMTLIDAAMAEKLYDNMGPALEVSGGSAGNSAAGIASLGGKCAFIGKVRNDQLGDIFRHDIQAIGVNFDTPAATDGDPTARCLIFVTPDAQRTMQTYLGACTDLTPADIDPAVIQSGKVTYMEGYLFDPPEAKKAFFTAADYAHQADRLVSLSLSDPFCVDRYRDEFRDLVKGHIDILFANEEEIKSLYQVDHFDDALQHVRKDCKIAALTRGPSGAVIVSGEEVHVVGAAPVEKVVDTTGAGDLFAAGFLYGYTHGYSLADSARIGAASAAEAISHFGARPETPLKTILETFPQA